MKQTLHREKKNFLKGFYLHGTRTEHLKVFQKEHQYFKSGFETPCWMFFLHKCSNGHTNSDRSDPECFIQQKFVLQLMEILAWAVWEKKNVEEYI